MIYESDYFVGSALNGDSLSHHGVPNQKWGVRHGPPYPIQRGRDVHYSVGKMTEKTKSGLQKAGKIASGGAKAVGSAVKSAGSRVKSSFKRWKENTKADLAIKDTNSKLVKNWQKKQLRISDMSNQELQQRIERKRLEESYKHALRGDFSDPKTWNTKSKNAKSSDGKNAADTILKKVGDAAIEGLTKGIANRIETKMTTKAKRKIERKEARRDAIAEVMREAAKERAQYRADQRNERWKERQDWKNQQRYNDGAMDPLPGGTSSGDSSFRSNRQSTNYGSYYAPTNSTGLIRRNRSSGDYYYASPGSWTIR